MVQHELSREELRWLYAVADAFVLPTRGEGWGLPVVEAMAMELPVVVTNATGCAQRKAPSHTVSHKTRHTNLRTIRKILD